MAEVSVQKNPVKPFFIRALLLFPLCVAVWLWLGDWQTMLAARFAEIAMPHLHPFADYAVSVQGKCINFLMLIPPHAPDPGTVRGKCYPLLQLSGIPLYLTIMLATPDARKHLPAMVLGILILALTGLLGVLIEASRHLLSGLVMLNVDLYKLARLPAYAPFVSNCLQTITMLFLPLIMPLGIWAWQRRQFVKAETGLVISHTDAP